MTTAKHKPLTELDHIEHGLTFAEYRELPGVNYHSLRDFCENPRLWHEGWFDRRPETPAIKLGTQIHTLLLQGSSAFWTRYARFDPPVNPKTENPYGPETKTYKEALLEWHREHPGTEPVPPETVETLSRILNETRRNPVLGEILRSPDADGAHSEVIFRGPLEGVPQLVLKGAIDRYDDQIGIIDLKTTSSLDDRFWRYTIHDREYIDQLAFYQIAAHDVCRSAGYPDAYIAAVETGGMFRSAAALIDPRIMDRARAHVLDLLARFSRSVQKGDYPDPGDTLRVIKFYRGDAPED